MLTSPRIVRLLALLVALIPAIVRAQITDMHQITGYVAGYDMRSVADGGSGPTFDLATGEVVSLGAELSGSGATAALTNAPRFQPGPIPGLIFPEVNDGGTSRPIITVTLPSAYPHRRMLALACITPLNMGGDYVQGGGRIFTTDSLIRNTGPFASLSKNWTNGAGGTLTEHGRLGVSGGSGFLNTVLRNGIERQCVALWNTSASGAFGYCNVNGSQNTTGSASASPSATFQVVDIGGFVPSGNGPLVGAVHAWHLFARTSGDYTQTDVDNGLALLGSQWSTSTSRDRLIVWCGDSIGYGVGTLYDYKPNTAVAGCAASTITSSLTYGITSLPVSSSAPFLVGMRVAIEPGLDNAEVVAITGIPDSTHLAVTTTFLTHDIGSVVCNDYFGTTTPYGKMSFSSKKAAGAVLFDFSRAGSRAVEVVIDPAADHSQDNLTGACTISILDLERGSNDLKTGIVTNVGLLSNAEAIADHAHTRGASKVMVDQVLDRVDFTTTQRGYAVAYNTALLTDAHFDGVVHGPDHPVLQHPEDPRVFTAPGADFPTFVRGCVYDPSGIHPRMFAETCRALMWDRAYATMMGEAVGYAPATPTVIAYVSGGLAFIEWSTPSEPDAPHMYGLPDGDGPCFITAIVRHFGEVLADYPPEVIDANTGDAYYSTDYIEADNPKIHLGTWTVQFRDAAGNQTPEVEATWLP